MRVFVISLITALFLNQKLSAQEPQRVESADSIANILKNSTKGLRYILSDSGINSELNEVGTAFFRNKYIIYLIKKEDTTKQLLTKKQIHTITTCIV